MQGPSLTVSMLPAGHGDAFLLRYISADGSAQNILIDGGVRETFHAFIEPALRRLADAGETLSLLVVTHIDDDHIGGVIELLIANKSARNSALIAIEEVWHNSYRHLPLPDARPPTDREKELVASQCRPVTHQTDKRQNISARQGSTLAALLRQGGYNWNSSFGGGPVLSRSATRDWIRLRSGLALLPISPPRASLANLAYDWRRELMRMGVAHNATDSADFEEAFESLLLSQRESLTRLDGPVSATTEFTPRDETTFIEDTSRSNGSSIALILEFPGHSALFLGDSHPSTIVAELNALGPVPHFFDLVKLSHHGSRRSTSPALLRAISSRNFLISTDGSRHGHPDADALVWILSSQCSGTRLTFNYRNRASERLGCEEATALYEHSVTAGDGLLPVSVKIGVGRAEAGPLAQYG